MAEVADVKKRRNANFSANDCVLLANIMGQSSGLNENLTNYQYIRHKFNSSITSSSKKKNWTLISEKFNSMAEVSRQCEDLIKKWDNLVQTHRSKYQDFQREQSLTGGGPCPGTLSAVTEAIINVIGRASENIVGVPGSSKNDISLIMLERLARETAQTKTTEENEIITEFVFPDNFTDSNELLEVPLHTTTKRSMTSISCIKCQCPECKHTRQLKKKKLELQIKYFSKIEQ